MGEPHDGDGRVGSEDPAGESPDVDLRAVRADLLDAVRRVCPPWLASQAEDITQRALLKVLDAVRGKGPRPLPRKYLARAAYTATVDEIRRRRVRAHDAPNTAAVEASAGQSTPEGRIALADLGRDIRDCLQGLAEDRRRAVTLHLLGYERAEVASALSRPAKSTDNLIYRGLADLRRCLRSKGHEP